jgi:hypothetical protein
MFFSSAITVEDTAAKLGDMDVVKACFKIIKKPLKNVTFNLNDKFCDGDELKESWENTPMLDQLLTFFSSLFNIHDQKFEMISMMEVCRKFRPNCRFTVIPYLLARQFGGNLYSTLLLVCFRCTKF